MRANFGDFGILVSPSKFWKKFVTRVRPYWDQFWKILTIEFWWNRKGMINHRGGILIFGQILSKMKILDFRVKDFKFCDFVKFWILRVKDLKFSIFGKIFSNLFKIHQKLKIFVSKIQILCARVKDFKFWFSLGLRISNFTKSPNSKFHQNHKFFTKKFLISQILWVLGNDRLRAAKEVVAILWRKRCLTGPGTADFRGRCLIFQKMFPEISFSARKISQALSQFCKSNLTLVKCQKFVVTSPGASDEPLCNFSPRLY